MELTLDPKMRDAALNVCEEMIAHMKTCEFAKTKTYKKHCTTGHAKDPNIKFDAVNGVVDINVALKKAISTFMTYGASVNEKSPKQVLESTIFMKMFFYAESDKANFDKLLKEEEFEDIAFALVSGTRSPAPMIVQHRLICGYGSIKKIDGKVYMCAKNLECPALAGYVTGNLINSTIILEDVAGKTRVTQFQLCDPSGNIPGWIYNTALDARNDILLLLKGFLEGEIKPEF
ncbi:Conserved_hypothetical protein [Hexamita inflata]|uniref:START domain-containing protein n=1 Tax=Hexamita inflata TaxID=28002 RepID=A0AA86RDM6_9EUKA|nr:Conserved hypothetical protein [Hexamita inflata]CAI9976021.1 Conserved hypothetical protein [Hexamita inflata]